MSSILSLNEVTIAGHLGKKPEYDFKNGVCNVSIATSKSWKDKNGDWQEKTTWVPLVIWGKTGESFCDSLTTGDNVWIRGELETSSYEKEGQTVSRMYVKVDRFKRIQKPE